MKKNIYKYIFVVSFITLIIFSSNKNNYYITKEYTSRLKSITNNGNKSYYMLLEAPSISLTHELYSMNSELNNVNKNIEVLTSDTPKKDGGNIILAGHSGNSKVSFFTNLDKLKENDEINIYYDNIKYTYVYKYKYEILKNGIANIYRDRSHNTLTMITCDENDLTKQIVFISELKKSD